MTTITIDTGESVSLGFEINGIDIADLIDFSVYFGNIKYSILDSTIEQDTSNERLFFVKIPSNVTSRMPNSNNISFSLVTEFLGVYKEDKIAILSVTKTNEKTSLPRTSEFITATFVIDVVTNVVTTNVILQQIYASGGSGGGSGTEYENLFSYTTGAQTFAVPSTLKIMSVTLNEGRVLRKTIEWSRTSSTQITILYPLEVNDTIYITGLTN